MRSIRRGEGASIIGSIAEVAMEWGVEWDMDLVDLVWERNICWVPCGLSSYPNFGGAAILIWVRR